MVSHVAAATSRYLYIFLLHLILIKAAALSCLTARGDPADWFFMLKAAGCNSNSSRDCTWHFLFDPASPPTSVGALNASASLLDPNPLGATLAALGAARLSPTSAPAFIHWSDDPPTRFGPFSVRAGATDGHAKGVLAADAGGGFWLTHSWPEFPDTGRAGAAVWRFPEGNPDAATTYGQSFLCVSLPLAGVDAVARALLAMEPLTYDAGVPPELSGALPAMAALARGERNRSAPLPSVVTVRSPAGRSFTHVSKNGAWGGELYGGAVAPALGVAGRGAGLWVETWRRGALNSSCNASGASVLNVKALSVTEGGAPAPLTQSFTTDHSKWAISVCGALAARGNGTGSARGAACTGAPGFAPWVCVGDINMMASQARRGGGTVCFDHAQELWGRLAEGVAAADVCPPPTADPPTPTAPLESATSSPSAAPTPSPSPSPSPSPTPLPTPSPTPTPTGTRSASPSTPALAAPPPLSGGASGAAEEAVAANSVAAVGATLGVALISTGVGLVWVLHRRAQAMPPVRALFSEWEARHPAPPWRERNARGAQWALRSLGPAVAQPRSPVTSVSPPSPRSPRSPTASTSHASPPRLPLPNPVPQQGTFDVLNPMAQAGARGAAAPAAV